MCSSEYNVAGKIVASVCNEVMGERLFCKTYSFSDIFFQPLMLTECSRSRVVLILLGVQRWTPLDTLLVPLPQAASLLRCRAGSVILQCRAQAGMLTMRWVEAATSFFVLFRSLFLVCFVLAYDFLLYIFLTERFENSIFEILKRFKKLT